MDDLVLRWLRRCVVVLNCDGLSAQQQRKWRRQKRRAGVQAVTPQTEWDVQWGVERGRVKLIKQFTALLSSSSSASVVIRFLHIQNTVHG